MVVANLIEAGGAFVCIGECGRGEELKRGCVAHRRIGPERPRREAAAAAGEKIRCDPDRGGIEGEEMEQSSALC
jgi:hypothetical protein